MSLKTYYSAVMARGKSGTPTVDEARKDVKAALKARWLSGPYF